MSKKVLVTKKGSSPKNSAEAELLQGCFTRYNLKARIRQVKIVRIAHSYKSLIITGTDVDDANDDNYCSGG